MSYLIKELPLDERPRERFKKYGVEALSNEELLSILLRTGTNNKSVREVSTDILREIKLHDLASLNYNTLKEIKGVGEVKAITLLSAIEFGKRVLSRKDLVNQILSSKDAYYLVKYVIFKKIIFIGTVNNSQVSLRDVFREGVKCNASAMIIVHNHPAGSISPSFDDVLLTNEFIKIGRLMGINVIDHLIIGKNNYYSFRESDGDLFAEEK